jgi:hypothetical protein
MVHLVLAVLGTVGGQTQGLVSHELLGAGVDGGSDSDTEQGVLVRDTRLSWEGGGFGRSSCAEMEGIYRQKNVPKDNTCK